MYILAPPSGFWRSSVSVSVGIVCTHSVVKCDCFVYDFAGFFEGMIVVQELPLVLIITLGVNPPKAMLFANAESTNYHRHLPSTISNSRPTGTVIGQNRAMMVDLNSALLEPIRKARSTR